MTPDLLLRILLTGAGATLCMDLWALLLKAALRHPFPRLRAGGPLVSRHVRRPLVSRHHRHGAAAPG